MYYQYFGLRTDCTAITKLSWGKKEEKKIYRNQVPIQDYHSNREEGGENQQITLSDHQILERINLDLHFSQIN